MNGHDEETYERKDLPTAFISREEHEKIVYKHLIKLDEQRERNKKLKENLTDVLALNKANDKIIKILTSGIKYSLETNDPKWLAQALDEVSKIGVAADKKFIRR